jgi:hypothetical protein
MKNEEVKVDKRNGYEKPIMRVVNIADSVQVLGIGCKSTVIGVAGPTRNPCIPGIRCIQPGS